MPTAETKFYEFDQNNSGGSFDIDPAKGIGPSVYIEATDTAHANARAEELGIYFNGVADGRDCACCGDRWHALWRDEEGVSEVVPGKYSFSWHDEIYVHRLDGTIETIRENAK